MSEQKISWGAPKKETQAVSFESLIEEKKNETQKGKVSYTRRTVETPKEEDKPAIILAPVGGPLDRTTVVRELEDFNIQDIEEHDGYYIIYLESATEESQALKRNKTQMGRRIVLVDSYRKSQEDPDTDYERGDRNSSRYAKYRSYEMEDDRRGRNYEYQRDYTPSYQRDRMSTNPAYGEPSKVVFNFGKRVHQAGEPAAHIGGGQSHVYQPPQQQQTAGLFVPRHLRNKQ